MQPRWGTLSKDDRYKINERIVQPLTMLTRLQLLNHLRNFREIPGEHHENGDGAGYWRIGLIAVACVTALVAAGYFALVTSFPPARLATLLGEQVKRATGRDFEVKGELSIRLIPALAVVANDVALGNADWGTRPEMLTVRHVAFAIALRPLLDGEIRILSVDVEGADILLETDDKGRENWMLSAQQPTDGESGAAKSAIDLEHLTMTNSRVGYRDATKEKHFGLTVEKIDMRMQGDQARLSLSFNIEEQRWQVDGQIGRLSRLLEGDWPFDLKFVTDGTKFAAKGKLGAGGKAGTIAAEVSAQTSNDSALKAFRMGETMLPIPLDVSATLVRTADSFHANPVRVLHAGELVEGQINITGSGQKLQVAGQLSAAQFDVAKWFPGSATPATSKQPSQLFGDTPLPFAALPSFPVRLDVRVARLLLPDAPPLSDVSGLLKAETGHLTIDPLSLTVDGGQIAGRVKVTHEIDGAPHTTLVIDARGLSVESLAGRSRNFRGGRADLKANLTLSGDTPRKLAASASGDVLLVVNNTELAGKATALERNPLESVLRALLPGQQAVQGLAIECAVVRLPLRRGVASIVRSIAMQTEQMAISASGQIDLSRQTLSLAFRPQVKKGLGLNQASLVQLVMLKGPLQAPEMAIDPKGAAQEAASIGVAVATGGLSLLAGRMLDDREAKNACKIAATGSPSSSASRRSVLGR